MNYRQRQRMAAWSWQLYSTASTIFSLLWMTAKCHWATDFRCRTSDGPPESISLESVPPSTASLTTTSPASIQGNRLQPTGKPNPKPASIPPVNCFVLISGLSLSQSIVPREFTNSFAKRAPRFFVAPNPFSLAYVSTHRFLGIRISCWKSSSLLWTTFVVAPAACIFHLPPDTVASG
ncbi:hypothetical protein BJ170DRAFT_191608 [Xylariales sp. AK1849]|nr:hypothetical protein BJ170DRAFT_191608 [Xylariales sp. AK1849]